MSKHHKNEVYKLVRELYELTRMTQIGNLTRLGYCQSQIEKWPNWKKESIGYISSLESKESEYYSDLYLKRQKRVSEIIQYLDENGILNYPLRYRSRTYEFYSASPFVWADYWLALKKGNYDPEFINKVENSIDTILGDLNKPYDVFLGEERQRLVETLNLVLQTCNPRSDTIQNMKSISGVQVASSNMMTNVETTIVQEPNLHF